MMVGGWFRGQYQKNISGLFCNFWVGIRNFQISKKYYWTFLQLLGGYQKFLNIKIILLDLFALLGGYKKC